MTKIDNGGPAFPIENYNADPFRPDWPGMSKRDWFAGMALQGFLAAHTPNELNKDFRNGKNPARTLATSAYALADAMIKVGEENDA